MVSETKTRSLVKSVLWRIVAILNSFIILNMSLTDQNIWNAIYMNITGLIVYYLYERIWNKVPHGKI
jgi:hypothetical protein